MDKYIQIGKVVATFGVKGEVIVQHELGTTPSLDALSTLFIEINKKSYIPYFTTAVQSKKEGEVNIKFETIDSKETARQLLKKKVYLTEKDFHQVVSPDSEIYLIQFKVEDSQEGLLGTIAEVISLPQGQLLGKVFRNNHELFIPLSEETIQRIDEKEKVIYVSLPEGLLEIYEG